MRALAVVLVVLCAAGCASRRVVVPPKNVTQLNDTEWSITKEPPKAPPR